MTGISYAIALSCVKISILIWYRRIFPNHRLRVFVWILTALSAGWGLAFVIADLLGCTPFHSFWNPIPSQHCLSGGGSPFVIANAVTNIAIDIPIMALPIPMIWNLQLRKGKKWGLRAVFLIGALSVHTCLSMASDSDRTYSVIVASGIRTRYLSTSLGMLLIVLLSGPYSLYPSKSKTRITNRRRDSANVHRLGLWTNVEPNMAIICASLPSLMPLFKGRKARPSKGSSGSSELKQYPDPPSKRSWPSARIRPDPDLEATINDVDDHEGQLLEPRRSSQTDVLSVTGH